MDFHEGAYYTEVGELILELETKHRASIAGARNINRSGPVRGDDRFSRFILNSEDQADDGPGLLLPADIARVFKTRSWP